MMAGYSGTPLAKKLGIKPGHTVLIVDEPGKIAELHASLPKEIELHTAVKKSASYDVALVFIREKKGLVARWHSVVPQLHVDGGLWISWPKKASGIASDLTEDVIRNLALAEGLVDNKVCAIDEKWSGLRLVYRVADREKVAAAKSAKKKKK
jgi:hypothetical protein